MWLSAAGLQVNDYRQSVFANNLANVSTTGFKKDLAVIRERAVESRTAPGGARFGHRVLDQLTGGPWVRPTVRSFEPGEFEETGNPLDVALDGEGMLTVGDGTETRFTRDGRMTLNRSGELVMVAGNGRWRVLDQSGGPIRLDPNQRERVRIAANGQIQQGDRVVGRLGLSWFEDPSQLTKVGGNLFMNHGSQRQATSARVRSGFIERSNLNPVDGLAGMVEVSRAYQLNANLISLQDQTVGLAVTTVGRIG